ncbi:hypothetical protein GQ54DRAFT_72723 [Martensiomyces pterosporus]|nr:hypothetical protein GQ54DRAFT_72723 [Martensiomyces pterosporus]
MALPYIFARKRLNFARPLTLPLLLVNFALGVLIFVQGCLSFSSGDVPHIMLGIVCLVFGLLVAVMELIHWAAIRMHASFLFSFFGRGLFYLVMGCLTLDSAKAQLGIGLVLIIFAAIFLAMSLVTSLHYDDPEDEYAAVIYNMQHGFPGGQQLDKSVLQRKGTHSMGVYSGQGISSETFNPSGLYPPQSSKFGSSMASGDTPTHPNMAYMEKAPRV